MADDEIEYIEIDGHRVDARKADRFYHGSDGRRVTDEEWDEDRRRARGESDVHAELRDTPPEGDIIASYDDEEGDE